MKLFPYRSNEGGGGGDSDSESDNDGDRRARGPARPVMGSVRYMARPRERQRPVAACDLLRAVEGRCSSGALPCPVLAAAESSPSVICQRRQARRVSGFWVGVRAGEGCGCLVGVVLALLVYRQTHKSRTSIVNTDDDDDGAAVSAGALFPNTIPKVRQGLTIKQIPRSLHTSTTLLPSPLMKTIETSATAFSDSDDTHLLWITFHRTVGTLYNKGTAV